MPLPRKLPGHCTICGAEVYEIRALSTHETTKGYPRRIGRPLPTARRVTLLLSDGSQCDLTFCADCAPSTDAVIGILAEAWQRVKECQVWEHEHRQALGARPPTAEQQATLDKNLKAFLDIVPVGVIAVRRLVDAQAD